jgi:hypothetical protein
VTVGGAGDAIEFVDGHDGAVVGDVFDRRRLHHEVDARPGVGGVHLVDRRRQRGHGLGVAAEVRA